MKKFPFLFIFCFATLSISAQCDSTKRPIVFIHGFMASGDTYAGQIQRLTERGYCADRLFLFDWNSVNGNGKITDSLLDAFINNVLLLTGAAQIDLVGHSAGGGLGRGYLIDTVDAAKVAHYIHLGSNKWHFEFPWFPNKKCLNIYSKEDKVMGSLGGDVDGATNLDLKTRDHYEVATCEETLNAIYQFINDDGKWPVIPTRLSNPVFVSGKAVILGDNTPMANATIIVHKLNAKNGGRTGKEPVAVLHTTPNGTWGQLLLKRNSNYEFELIPGDTSQPTISYFFEPFTSSNANIYLRGFPKGNMIGMMLNDLPRKTDQSVIVIYSSSKAMIAGRDSVTVNGTPVSSPALTPAGKTIISSFIFDDGDGMTSGKGLKQFSVAPFIGGVDIYLPVKKKTVNTIYYNGRKLILPAYSSKERIMLAVFN